MRVLQEPKQYVYELTVRKFPKFLFKALGTYLFGFTLDGCDCHCTVNKRKVITLRFARGTPYGLELTPGRRPRKFRVYGRTNIIDAIRLAWLWLRSKRVRNIKPGFVVDTWTELERREFKEAWERCYQGPEKQQSEIV